MEADPLFERLRRWPGGALIHREPLRSAHLAWPKVAEDAPQLAAAGGLNLDEDVAEWIRRIGEAEFERAFLKCDEPSEREAAARAAGLDAAQADRISRLVDSLWLLDVSSSPAPQAPVHCIAAYERGPLGLEPSYFSPHYLRGRYRVDYAALETARAAVAPREWEKMRGLLGRLELANRKLTALGRVLEALPALQPAFLETGDPDLLAPLRQNGVAADLGLSPSALCRALAGRSVRLPQGREAALVDFFPTTRARTARLIRLVAGRLGGATDEAVRAELGVRYGVRVTRRLVNLRRNEPA